MRYRAFFQKSFLIFLFVLMGVTGCMGSKSYTNKMVSYMSKKYDDVFEYSAPFGGGTGATSKQIIVKSKKYPFAQIWVEYYTKDGKEIFTDNYISYKYEEQTRDTLQKLLEDVFHADVNLIYEIGSKGFRNDFTEKTSFEEYISSFEAGIVFQAFVLYSPQNLDFSDIETKLKEKIEAVGLVSMGSIYFTDDKSDFDKAKNLPYPELEKMPCLSFYMDSPGSFLGFEWSDRHG